MADYTDIGLDPYLQNRNSPIQTDREITFGPGFDSKFEIQQKHIRTSNISIKNLIRQGQPGTAAGGPFNDGDSLKLTVTLTPDTNYSDTKVLPLCEAAIYIGTAANDDDQLFPKAGVNVDPIDYEVSAGWDYNKGTLPSVMKYVVAITNLTAGAINIFAVAQMRYIQERAGTADQS